MDDLPDVMSAVYLTGDPAALYVTLPPRSTLARLADHLDDDFCFVALPNPNGHETFVRPRSVSAVTPLLRADYDEED